MAAFNKFSSFVEAVSEKSHNLGSDALTYALTTAAPVAGNTQLSDLTQISYTFLSSRVPSITSSAQTGGVYKLVLANLVLTATGGSVGPFRYVTLYNATAVNSLLIGWYDYGASLTLLDGETLTITNDPTTGVIQLT